MSARPESLTKEPYAAAYDWLAANGIDEWLPEGGTIKVKGGRITYTAFQFEGGRRGYDGADIVVKGDVAATEQRTVPLVVPLTDKVRAAFRVGGLTLKE